MMDQKPQIGEKYIIARSRKTHLDCIHFLPVGMAVKVVGFNRTTIQVLSLDGKRSQSVYRSDLDYPHVEIIDL